MPIMNLSPQKLAEHLSKNPQALNGMSQEDKRALLSNVDSYGLNVLMYAAHRHPKAVAPLLEAIKTLDKHTQVTILKQTDKYSHGRSALMWVASRNSDAVSPLLEVIQKWDKHAQAAILKQTDRSNSNALMLSFYSQPESVELLLRAISHLDKRTQAAILKQTDTNGRVALANAASHQPGTIPLLLKAMNVLDKEEQTAILKDITVNGSKALMWVFEGYERSSIEQLVKAMRAITWMPDAQQLLEQLRPVEPTNKTYTINKDSSQYKLYESLKKDLVEYENTKKTPEDLMKFQNSWNMTINTALKNNDLKQLSNWDVIQSVLKKMAVLVFGLGLFGAIYLAHQAGKNSALDRNIFVTNSTQRTLYKLQDHAKKANVTAVEDAPDVDKDDGQPKPPTNQESIQEQGTRKEGEPFPEPSAPPEQLARPEGETDEEGEQERPRFNL